MSITEKQQRAIFTKMQEKERELGKRISISTFLREYVLNPYLNGNSSSPPQETEIETTPKEKSVWDNLEF